MRWIYLSPHLDHAVLSAGGWINEQTRAGNPVEIWTVMCGDPHLNECSMYAQVLHRVWGFSSVEETVRESRKEDNLAASIVGATIVHFDFLDCIYRRDQNGDWLYSDISVPPHEADASYPARIAEAISSRLRPDDQLLCQLALGSHVDHVLVRQAAELLGKQAKDDLSRRGASLAHHTPAPILREARTPLTVSQPTLTLVTARPKNATSPMPTPNKRNARQPAADVDKQAEAAPEPTAAKTATNAAVEATEQEIAPPAALPVSPPRGDSQPRPEGRSNQERHPRQEGQSRQQGQPRQEGQPRGEGQPRQDGQPRQEGQPRQDGQARQEGQPRQEGQRRQNNQVLRIP